MHKKIILKAFEKAKEEQVKFGVKNPSLTRLASDISDFLEEYAEDKIGEKSLRLYFNNAKRQDEEKDINIKNKNVLNGLCLYLGYEDYKDFIMKEEPAEVVMAEDANLGIDAQISIPTASKGLNILIKKNKITIVFGILVLFCTVSMSYLNRERWMIWQEDRYIEVSFDVEKYSLSKLKIYNPDRISNFRKVILTSDSTFFSTDGKPKYWYGKSANGTLEYFTSVGLHPETGKTLKPISWYMINKYILDTKKKQKK